MEIPKMFSYLGYPALWFRSTEEVIVFQLLDEVFEWLEDWLDQLLTGMPREGAIGENGKFNSELEFYEAIHFLVDYVTNAPICFPYDERRFMLNVLSIPLEALLVRPYEAQPILEFIWLVAKHYSTCEDRLVAAIRLVNAAADAPNPWYGEMLYTVARLEILGIVPNIYQLPHSLLEGWLYQNRGFMSVMENIVRLYGDNALSRANIAVQTKEYDIFYDPASRRLIIVTGGHMGVL